MGRGTHGEMGNHDYFDEPCTLADNLPDVTKSYPFHDGYFGVKGRRSTRRRIECNDPLAKGEDFYKRITIGAYERKSIYGGNGELAKMLDGSSVSFRRTSQSDGTPAIEIGVKQIGMVKPQRIHFVKKGAKDENL